MRRYKKDDFQEKETEQDLQERWDLKKVAIGFLFIILILIGIGYVIVHSNIYPPIAKILSRHSSGAVEGASTQAEGVATPSAVNITNKLNSLKKEITHLNVGDIAKNSPQIQKIQRDFQSLENLPGKQAKQACLQICSGL